MVEQKVLIASSDYAQLDDYIRENGFKTVFLVCDASLGFLKLNDYFNKVEDRLGIRLIKFTDFKPNPLYESVEKGVAIFNKEKCDAIFAVGGGSAMDVAKCIKLYSNMDHTKNYLVQEIVPNEVPLFAVPTTAGTGSEATRYAVIYFNGEKQSVADVSCIPSTVLMDASVLNTLPLYQKKATMLDAFCHAIESFWSVNSTEESMAYSKEAIELIMVKKEAYLANEEAGNAAMLRAANIAGKAINITQTTAGHAMCYKLTSLYGIAHGHAAALCLSKLWPYMLEKTSEMYEDIKTLGETEANTDMCMDSRGVEYVKNVFDQIAEAMGCKSVAEAVKVFNEFLDSLHFDNIKAKEEDFDILCNSVNPIRLKNNPISLDKVAIDELYRQICKI